MRVWIIGGNKGIGAAVTKEIATYPEVEVCPTDENDATVISFMQLQNMFYNIDPHAIVYCAGVNVPMPAREFNEWDAMNMLDINVLGFMRVIRLTAEGLKRGAVNVRNVRSIVAIGSDAATRPMRNSMAYCASKAALHAAVRCAARELAPDVRVNAVAPGTVAGTAMTEAVDQQIEQIKHWPTGSANTADVTGNPMGRRAEAKEIAKTVAFALAGPEYLTGTIIEVNGGR